MAEDIAPALLKNVQKAFGKYLKKYDVNQKEIIQAAKDGKLNSITLYTEQVGKALSRAFMDEITVDALPDGTLYYNIAEKVIIPPIKEAHEMVSEVADEIQSFQNKRGGLGLKPIRPPIEMERVDGLIDILTQGPFFEENIGYLNEPVRNLVNHFGDYHIEKNAEFMGTSGVDLVITRTTEATACEWCQERAGTYYSYEEAAFNEAFSRHEGCRCELMIRNGKTNTAGKMATSGHAFVRS